MSVSSWPKDIQTSTPVVTGIISSVIWLPPLRCLKPAAGPFRTTCLQRPFFPLQYHLDHKRVVGSWSTVLARRYASTDKRPQLADTGAYQFSCLHDPRNLCCTNAFSGIEPLAVLLECGWPIPNPSIGRIRISPTSFGSIIPLKFLNDLRSGSYRCSCQNTTSVQAAGPVNCMISDELKLSSENSFCRSSASISSVAITRCAI